MEYDKKLPQDYMTVGEMAKKMGVTVRTLQYYDQQGLLSPSAESEGGRRLYTDRDMILLHQILSLKHLGFSLDAIKNHLTALETPADVAAALTEQASVLRRKIETLSESLQAIEEEFWNMIQEFTAGDESLLENLMEIGSFDGLDDEWKARQTSANAYLGPALDAYLTELGINPFEEDRE